VEKVSFEPGMSLQTSSAPAFASHFTMQKYGTEIWYTIKENTN